MNALARLLGGALLLAVLASGSAAGAAEPEDSEARALSILKKSADFVSKAKRFRLHAELAYDVVQEDGETLEFGATRTVTVRRPDRTYAESLRRDGHKTRFYFDGQAATKYDVDQNVYASAKIPGTLDAMLDYLIDRIGVPAPLADLSYSDLYSVMREKIDTGFHVGPSMVQGVACQHLAFQDEDADWQIWIEDGDQPLPRRIVITYKTFPGSPQFRAHLIDWDLEPKVPDSLFTFERPTGAQQIPFVAKTKFESESP